MSLLLLIHSYGGANETVKRHWPFYEKFGADRIVGVSTEMGDCRWPDGIERFVAGDGRYMNGPNLPTRLLKTIEYSMGQPELWCACIEYDTLALQPGPFGLIPGDTSPHAMVFCHRTGGQTFGSKSSFFSHNPWVWNKHAAAKLVVEMRAILAEGHCAYGTPESSPDVFWAYACERSGVTIAFDYWSQFTRNSFDLEGDLELACRAAADGVQVLHGIKTEQQLAAIVEALK